MVVSGAFVIAFPTLVSAMTGYSSNIQPFVAIDGKLAPFSDFLLVKYIIHDGSRIGLSDDHIVAAVHDNSSEPTHAVAMKIARACFGTQLY